MEIVYLLIPLSLILIVLIAWIFLWAIRSGQFDDMEGPAHRILMDDDSPRPESAPGDAGQHDAGHAATATPGDAAPREHKP